MIALPGIAIQDKIHESLHSLLFWGIRAQDKRATVVKLLKQEYPSLQEITRYRQEYAIPKPGRSSQSIQLLTIESRHLISQA